MKTIKDAYKELKGDIENTMFHNGTETTLSYNVRQLKYVTGHRTESDSSFQYICTVEEFKGYKPNPIYTQEMHEAGELPSVGAKFKVVKVEVKSRIFDFKNKEVEVIGLSKNGENDIITFSHPIMGIGCGNYNHYWIEPLTVERII